MTDEEDKALGGGKSCFVISPIGSKLAPIGTPGNVIYENSAQMWESVLEPACAAFGLQPLRSDKLAQPGEITDQIFQLLRDSDVVVADLTGGNANVMYELGLRHTRDLVTIQIGEYERLPFDVNTIRTLQFTRSEAGLIELRRNLVDMLRAGLKGEGSPVTATRLWSGLAVADPAAIALAIATSEPDADAEDQPEEPGFLDVLYEGETAMASLGQIMQEAVTFIGETGAMAEAATSAIAESDARGGGFAGRLVVARGLAENLTPPGTELEKLADDFRKEVAAADAMVRYLLERIQDEDQAMDEAAEFLRQILGVVAAAEGASVGIGSMMREARDMGRISRALRDPGMQISRALNRFLESINVTIAWGPLVRNELEARGLADDAVVGS